MTMTMARRMRWNRPAARGRAGLVGLVLWPLSQVCAANVHLQGQVLDLNGAAVRQAQVTLNRPTGIDGALTTTVFTDDAGRFDFTGIVDRNITDRVTVEVRALGYRQVSPATGAASGLQHARRSGDTAELLFVMQAQQNKAATAPPSAWLQSIPESPRKATLIRECISCHQFPTSQVREYAVSLNDSPASDSLPGRKQAWTQMARYMSLRMAQFFQKGMDITASYMNLEETDADLIVSALAKELPRRFDAVEYDYGAPLAVTSKTVIREYTVPGVNAIREAILTHAGKSAHASGELWVADVGFDRLVRIDAATGRQREYRVPHASASGPSTLANSPDGSIWVTMLFNNLLGRLDPATGTWRVLTLKTTPPGMVMSHDIALDSNHEVGFDAQHRLWLTDTANNALVGVNIESGASETYLAPKVPGRSNIGILMYGAVMTSDKRHLWYTQLGGNFGAFDIAARRFDPPVEVPAGTGPRRLGITGEDILYVPLFGSGQILEYDARTRRQLAIYDLPDRASAPYAVTWDAKRRVLWIATANANAVYRFDPASKEFGVIPLPRQKAFLRMLEVDAESGLLVTCYANLPETADGPRMAVIIEPGDDVD